jgi:hypothetical protein
VVESAVAAANKINYSTMTNFRPAYQTRRYLSTATY